VVGGVSARAPSSRENEERLAYLRRETRASRFYGQSRERQLRDRAGPKSKTGTSTVRFGL
jgi:hypothetical protein